MSTFSESLKPKVLDVDDLEYLHKISDKFIIPDTSNPLVVVSFGLTDTSSNILGAGFVSLVGEATIAINPDLNKLEKADVLNQLFLTGRMKCEKVGLDKLVVFTPDKLYARFLKKRYCFDDRHGIGLVLEL